MGEPHDTMALRVATEFYKAAQPLAAAVVYAELAQGGASSAQLWCGLGSALMGSRGVFVRAPFESWAARAFHRGAPLFAGTPYAAVVDEWRADLPPGDVAPLDDAALAALLKFLMVEERVLVDAAAKLPPEEAMGAVMTLGDRDSPLYMPLLRAAVMGELGDGAARAALKRIGRYAEWPEIQAAVLVARDGPKAAELGPYLTSRLPTLPADVDRPRGAACPPYRGIGDVAVELVHPGVSPAACAEVLRVGLRAAPRDARSWAQFAPCVVKRGALRNDALRLQQAVAPLGATLVLRDPDEPPRDAPTRPWWKLW
jgi:hypothetical protein